MNEYKLINPSSILNGLNNALNDISDQQCIKHWGDTINKINKMDCSKYITWESIERFETIHFFEAVFLLLSLPTEFILKNNKFDLYRPYSNCNDEKIRNIFTHTIEYQALEQSHQEWTVNEDGEVVENSFEVAPFIQWAIDKCFIERLDAKIDKGNKGHGFDKHNSHKSRAKQHNTKVVVKAYKNYIGHNKPNSLLASEETSFYKKLKDELVSKTPDGDEKPSAKTLLNYLSEHKNKK